MLWFAPYPLSKKAKMMTPWLEAKQVYIRGLKVPSVQQKLLLLLSEKTPRSKEEDRKLTALIRAERAIERVAKEKANISRILNAEKKAERRSRNRELFQAAGLMMLANLVDSKTGMPLWDKGELLGGLMALAATADETKRKAWKTRGDALLTEKSAKKSKSNPIEKLM